jgi:hypothetical protein
MGTEAPARGEGRSGGKRKKWPYRFELVPLDRLFIDADYQRPLTSFVEQVAADYDPAMVGTLITSEREDGRLAVIDGQTRMEAMRMNGEGLAPCLVYPDLTREQEAELFADLQTKRRGMSSFLRFRAALVARKTEAIAIAAIVNQAGFELDVRETQYTVKAIAALENVYRRDPELLMTTMQVIRDAWPDVDTDYRTGGDLIRGLARFLGREARVDRERLVDRLAAVTPRMIQHRANALMEGSGHGQGGRAGYMADAILGIYMRGKPRATTAA